MTFFFFKVTEKKKNGDGKIQYKVQWRSGEEGFVNKSMLNCTRLIQKGVNEELFSSEEDSDDENNQKRK
jgi:hypothetical protein